MGSQSGRVWLTAGANTGGTGNLWKVIANPTDLDSSNADALAFGAPTTANGQPDNFIYAGTADGNVFVTYIGGGYNGSSKWANISTGIAGNGPIEEIVTDTKPESSDAYAVTPNGVYYMPNSVISSTNPTPTWVKISNLTGATTTLSTGSRRQPDHQHDHEGDLECRLPGDSVRCDGRHGAIRGDQCDRHHLDGCPWLQRHGSGRGHRRSGRHPANELCCLACRDQCSIPIPSTTLTTSGGINATATTITVASNAGFPTTTPFVVTIGSEQVDVTNVAGTTWTIVRGLQRDHGSDARGRRYHYRA